MSIAAAVCAGVAVLLGRHGRARLRLRSEPDHVVCQEVLTRSPSSGRVSRRTAVASVVAASTLMLAAFGPLAVVGVTIVLAVALGLRAVKASRDGAADIGANDDVALCIDLMAAAMTCGASPAVALRAVLPGVPGPAGEALGTAATALALGADPGSVWSVLGESVPPLRQAARACARAAWSGAGIADELFRLAATARADRQVDRRRRLQRAGVWLVLPLGLCFLPAFVLVGVVPVVLAAVPALAG